jgi:hypothetical protein
MDASQRWYKLDRVTPPWGDYGDILLSGMTAHQPRTRTGLLRLERTGPFVPPITLAGLGDLLVTEEFRAGLEQSSLAGPGFRPVEKTRIVHLEWERWDQAGVRRLADTPLADEGGSLADEAWSGDSSDCPDQPLERSVRQGRPLTGEPVLLSTELSWSASCVRIASMLTAPYVDLGG